MYVFFSCHHCLLLLISRCSSLFISSLLPLFISLALCLDACFLRLDTNLFWTMGSEQSITSECIGQASNLVFCFSSFTDHEAKYSALHTRLLTRVWSRGRPRLLPRLPPFPSLLPDFSASLPACLLAVLPPCLLFPFTFSWSSLPASFISPFQLAFLPACSGPASMLPFLLHLLLSVLLPHLPSDFSSLSNCSSTCLTLLPPTTFFSCLVFCSVLSIHYIPSCCYSSPKLVTQ